MDEREAIEFNREANEQEQIALMLWFLRYDRGIREKDNFTEQIVVASVPEKYEFKQEYNKYAKGRFYRYSLSYAVGGKYNKNFRAEIYTNTPQDEVNMTLILDEYIHEKLRNYPGAEGGNGLRQLFTQARLKGLEAEEVGLNDVGISEIGVLYFYFERFI